MTLAAEYIYWISLAVLIYTYVGYPVLIALFVQLKKLFSSPAKYQEDLPPVTLVIAAYNEEQVMRQKIKNSLELDYPAGLLKIIIITDGSTDSTPTIVKEYTQVVHLHESARKGKLAAMNRAMSFVDTGLVVFSDANGYLNRDCLKKMMPHFSDPKTGGVTGEKRILKLGTAVGEGEGLYWKYESLLKKLDSKLYTVVGAAGELFSIRKSVFEPMDSKIIIEDFVQSLNVCRRGYVVKYEPLAYSEEDPSSDIKDEMERKIRISAGGFQAMVLLRSLFNFFRHPVLTFQFVSHRVLRWTLCPLALITVFAGSIMAYYATGGVWYGLSAVFLGIFYIMGVVGWVYARRNVRHGLFYLPFYFLFMHFCVFAGFSRYVSGRQNPVWKKAVRS